MVNLPYLINSFDKLDQFVGNKKLFDHFLMAMDHQGIMGLDITGYGNYGWATTIPVKTIADAKKVKFSIAEAAVNQLNYKEWGFNPVVMPWPDVPVALKQGVITGLDHTPTVCNITKKFEVAKYFTQVTMPRDCSSGFLTKPGLKAFRPIFKRLSRMLFMKFARKSVRKAVNKKLIRSRMQRKTAFSSLLFRMKKQVCSENKGMSPMKPMRTRLIRFIRVIPTNRQTI